jgi:ring-1,2-phenylacetyl-CoA epoxidase subunit PaaD
MDSAAVVPAASQGSAAAAAAWAVLQQVLDPEVPALSVCELGIVREVEALPTGGLRVVLTPTYSGCPATEVIEASVVSALVDAGLGPVQVQQRRSPAWSSDWISAAGREKLRAYGIAPPCTSAAEAAGDAAAVTFVPLRFHARALACPRCGSRDTELLSAFGATACKALHRCRACREPFEHFKPI